MQLVVVSAVAAAVMAATKTFNSTSQKLFLFIRYSFLLSEHESHESHESLRAFYIRWL